MADTRRIPADVGVVGARPYGIAGNLPTDAITTTYRPHGNGVLYYSDAPFVQSYNDRPTCAGHRKDGHPCKAKAESGDTHCSAHADQR